MKTLVLLIALALATPALAADVPQPGTPAQLCSTYAQQTPAGILKLLYPAIKQQFTDREIPRSAQPRVVKCILGALPNLRNAVLDQCLVGGDPSPVVAAAFSAGVEPCFSEAAEKPVHIFPPAAASTTDVPDAGGAPAAKGLLP